jgi:cobalamin-dependent methionine synthase I
VSGDRKLLNQVFAWLCREAGMDGAIANPQHINGSILDGLDPKAEQFELARAFLVAEDQFGMSYISAVRAGRI